MAHVHKSKLSLRISADALIPAEVTEMLGAEPTTSNAKGDKIGGNGNGPVRIANTGSWLLSVDDHSPENLDGQLRKLFDGLTDDMDVWQQVHQNYSADLFCGLFMEGSNEGLTLTASVINMIAVRNLEIGFDIYI